MVDRCLGDLVGAGLVIRCQGRPPAHAPLLTVGAVWLATGVIARRRPPVGMLAVLVALAWFAPLFDPGAVMWHRALLVHLLLGGARWWPSSRVSGAVVVGAYLASGLGWPWVAPGSAVVIALSLVAGAAVERTARPVSVFRLPAWQWATFLVAAAFAAPPLLALAGVDRAWALPVLFAYSAAHVVVAALVALATAPRTASPAADVAVDLRFPTSPNP